MRLTDGDSNASFNHRFDMIELLRTEAAQLLTTVTEQAPQQQLHLALCNLDEAETWVSSNVADSPAINALIELLLELAASRIQIVGEAVRAYGSQATTLKS